MTTLKDIEPQLLSLTASEKARAISILSQSLANSWQGIEKTLRVFGGRACVGKTCIPVWVLVNARRLEVSEAELLEDYPTITATDLVNAWAYAEMPPNIPLYSSLVPINLAREFNIFDRQLYRFSTTFSYQLAYRYIFGLDLEFDQNIINTAKGYRRESVP